MEQPYRVAGRRSPAPAPHLDEAWTAVVARLGAAELAGLPLVTGGRSMGARVACRTAAATASIGVVCLAFPLKPPQRANATKPSPTRLPELDAVAVPTLVVQGVNDRFGMPPSGPSRSVIQVAGDHGLKADLPAVQNGRRAVAGRPRCRDATAGAGRRRRMSPATPWSAKHGCRRAGAPGEAAHSGNAPAPGRNSQARPCGDRRMRGKFNAWPSKSAANRPALTPELDGSLRLMHDAKPATAPPHGEDDDAPWRAPVRGGHPDAALAARPGIEFLRALLAGETPSPPLARLTGMQPVTLTADSARYTMPLSPWLCGDDGRVPLGVLAIPADAAMACAIIADLPAGTAITTSELALRQVRPARPGATVVTTAHGDRPGPSDRSRWPR